MGEDFAFFWWGIYELHAKPGWGGWGDSVARWIWKRNQFDERLAHQRRHSGGIRA